MREIVLQTGVNQIGEDDYSLSKFCTLLLEEIICNKVIRERTIFDFCKQVVKILGQNELPTLPDSFYILADHVDEYQRCDMENEIDIRRATSYSRIFQMTQMLYMRIKEEKNIQSIECAINKNLNNQNLLAIISCTPWITHKELSSKMKISPPALTYKIATLEQDGFVMSRRQGKQKHYFLTEQGETLRIRLSQEVSLKQKCSPVKQQLFYACIDIVRNLESEDLLSTVREIINYIDKIDDKKARLAIIELQKLCENLYQYRQNRNHRFSVSDMITYDSCSDNTFFIECRHLNEITIDSNGSVSFNTISNEKTKCCLKTNENLTFGGDYNDRGYQKQVFEDLDEGLFNSRHAYKRMCADLRTDGAARR